LSVSVSLCCPRRFSRAFEVFFPMGTMGRRGKHASFVDVGGGTHYIVTDNESLLALKNAILEDPVVASNSVARDGDYERFQLYFRQLVLLGEIPLEDTPWERDEVQNMLDRVYLGVEQATCKFSFLV
jgi:hypothetical protein